LPGKADLKIYQGDDFSATVTVRNADLSLANISGYTASAQIRSGPADQYSTIIAQLSATVSSPYVYLALGNAFTALLTQNHYVWDLQLISGSGIKTTILHGDVYPTSEVTRP